MADEATQEVQTSPAETPAVESQPNEQTTPGDAGDTQESTEQSQTSDTDSKADASTGDKKPSETQDVKQESKPLSRRSAAYRIQQLVEENKNLRKEAGKPVQENEWDEKPATDEPSVADLVAKEVERRLNPVISESTKAADDAELSELFKGNEADRTKYEGKLRSMWNLPQYKDVAALDLYNMLRGKEMDQIVSQAKQQGAEEYKKAEKEAKESSGSGNSNSNRTGKGKSVADMTSAELEVHNQRVIAGLPT